MRRVGMIGILLTALIIISGCGGSGGGTQVSCTTDNSGNQENEFGYYGGDTKFCKYTVARDWEIIDPKTDETKTISFYTDGRYVAIDDGITQMGEYGVSKNGQTIELEYATNKISITGVNEGYMTYKKYGKTTVYDCYYVTGFDRNILMCPTPKTNGALWGE